MKFNADGASPAGRRCALNKSVLMTRLAFEFKCRHGLAAGLSEM
jgi:hypothetical protein